MENKLCVGYLLEEEAALRKEIQSLTDKVDKHLKNIEVFQESGREYVFKQISNMYDSAILARPDGLDETVISFIRLQALLNTTYRI